MFTSQWKKPIQRGDIQKIRRLVTEKPLECADRVRNFFPFYTMTLRWFDIFLDWTESSPLGYNEWESRDCDITT